MGTRRRETRRAPRRTAIFLAATVLMATLAAATPAQGITNRHRMLEATNKSRQIHGRAPLKINFKLSQKALRHTYDMARAGSLYHSPSVPQYLKPYRWWTWGENVGFSYGTAKELHRAYMDSPAHRRNVLNRAFTKVGIGAKRIDGVLWTTLVFYG